MNISLNKKKNIDKLGNSAGGSTRFPLQNTEKP